MVLFGVRFVYDDPHLTEQQVRVASTRAAYAQWSRNLARQFAAAKKASLAKKRRTVREDRPPSAREEEAPPDGLPSPCEEKETVTVGAPQFASTESTGVPPWGNLPSWEDGKEIVTVGL